jgi:hypothetical protein
MNGENATNDYHRVDEEMGALTGVIATYRAWPAKHLP